VIKFIDNFHYQINKRLISLYHDVKLMLKITHNLEKYCNICFALFGHLLTKIFNVKLNTQPMQNFTLGKKGYTMLLFALVLLIGSSPTFGQTNCPTAPNTPPDQTFCYLQTVGDIETDGNAIFATANSTTDTQPIPDSELLDNTTYYAGNQASNCTSRLAINVTVNAAPYPNNTLFPGENSFTISPCSNTFTAEELATYFTPIANYNIQVYSEEFGNTVATGPLTPNESYFVGQVNPSQDNSTASNCPSLRVAVGYEPKATPPPNANSPQTFCAGDTVGDLEAEGTSPDTQAIRWYRTNTSFQPLPDNTILIDGQTYYATQIINDRNDPFPPCESETRTAVVVNVIFVDAGPDNTDNVLCISEADGIFNTQANARDYFLTLLSNNSDSDPANDVPTNGSFSGDDLATIVANYNDGTKVDNYQTTYTADFGNGCTDSVVLGTRVETDPNAGDNTEVDVCVSDFSAFLPLNPAQLPAAQAAIFDYIESTGTITPGGTFSPSITDLFAQINDDFANDNFPKTYTVIYTVDNNGCEDSSELTLNVQDENDAGANNSETLCENEVDDRGIFANEASLRAYYVDLLGAGDDSGSFNPLLADLILAYNDGVDTPSEDFTTEYTVSTSTACAPATSTATLTVTAAIAAEAGTGTPMTYCSNNASVDLSTLLTGANPNGVFSSDDADVTDGNFDPSDEGAGTFSILYTVSPATACVTGTSTSTITITVEEAADAGTNDSATFCETDAAAMTAFEDENSLKAYLLDLLGTEDDRGTFNPTLATLIVNYDDGIDGAEDFSTIYTIEATTVCDESTATATITINEAVPADAGTIANVEDICSNDEVLTLSDYLGTDSMAGGTFSSDDADVADGTFDPSANGAGSYKITYTIGEDDACVTGSDSTDFTIKVDQAPNAGPGGNFSFCQSEFEALAAQVVANPAGKGIELLNEFDTTITSGGDFTNSTLTQLLAQYAATTSFPATFTSTYTVSNDDCTDSADYSVTINPDTEADAGINRTNLVFCITETNINLVEFLSNDANTDGTFSGAGVSPEGVFNPSLAGTGPFEITYNVTDDANCVNEGSVDTATFTGRVEDLVVANAGEDRDDLNFCIDGTDVRLLDFLTSDANRNGTFSGEGVTNGFFSPSTTGAGLFTVTYIVSSDDFCIIPGTSDDATFTINVRTPSEANSGGDQTPTAYCIEDDEDVVLISLLGQGANTFGTFKLNDEEIISFNPAQLGVGEFEIIYTVEGSDDCAIGIDRSTITITVNEAPTAPTATSPQPFCLIDNPTVGDITVTGDNVVFYTDAGLGDDDIVDATTALINAAVYYAVANNDTSTCSSDATMITVTITDPSAPSLQTEGNEFCRSDNPTVQDLINNFTGSGVLIYTSSTGGSIVTASTALQNGVTYYGASVDGTSGCESTERLAVIAKVEFCGIPEGFSPNGDGINDRFVIPDIAENFPNYSIEIFNRWGNVVFKGNASTPDWDGISNQSGTLGNDVLPVGVYFYILNYNDGQTSPVQGKLYLSI